MKKVWNAEEKLQYERALLNKGIKYIAGVDEVGRGPLAGPVVCAAVIMPLDDESIIIGVDDSKKLSAKKREMLAEEIVEACRYSQLEELIQNLIQQIKENQSFTADSRTEEMGDNGMLLELFGTSELAKETDKMQDLNAKSSGKNHQKESSRNGNLSMASNGQMKHSQDEQTMSTLEESAVEEAVQEADFDSREEIEISIRSGYQSKKSQFFSVPRYKTFLRTLPDSICVYKEDLPIAYKSDMMKS